MVGFMPCDRSRRGCDFLEDPPSARACETRNLVALRIAGLAEPDLAPD